MSYLTHINRHDDYIEDFEEAIARNIKEEDYENNESDTEGINNFEEKLRLINFSTIYSLFPLYFRFSNL